MNDDLRFYENDYFDGESFTFFYVEGVNYDDNEIVLTVSNSGRLFQRTFDLFADKHGRQYFEYGAVYSKIYLDEFTKPYGRAL